jgi:hypothetical protein
VLGDRDEGIGAARQRVRTSTSLDRPCRPGARLDPSTPPTPLVAHRFGAFGCRLLLTPLFVSQAKRGGFLAPTRVARQEAARGVP